MHLAYTPTTSINGISAAYKGNGDIALFFADQSTLYVMKCISGSWQDKVSWDKSTGDLSGAAAVYDGDWNLLVTGQDSNDNYKLWSLVYGDGGDVSAGSWSALKELASAPSGGDFEYHRVFLGKPDVCRAFFIEKFTETDAYDRPFWSYSVPDAGFLDSLWHEPVPFNLSCEYGLAIAHYGDYCWLSSPDGVWRAKLTVESLDLTGDVLSVREELKGYGGRLVVELRNDDGRYASPGSGDISVLALGCQLDFSPGYRTSSGNESSSGPGFIFESWEHTSSGGKATLMLSASDGWDLVKGWIARHQFRWNKESNEMCVKDILAFILARLGLKLEVKSQSSVMTGYYPDFTINPNNRGDAVVSQLLTFVPDVLFIEGGKVCVVNPQSSDSSVYSYGTSHSLFEGKYRKGAWECNRIEVEGFDTVGGDPIIVNSFAWDEIDRADDRLRRVRDRNLDSAAKAQDRGDAFLREAEIESAGGGIRVPANCGQQLYDVIDITDGRAGLEAEKKRVLGITLVFNPGYARYEQWLALGAV
ncbi:hypothetical protein ACFLVF_03445 [Chloroflexota bacterium]